MSTNDKYLYVNFDINDLELVFTYIERQKQVLEAQGQPMLPYTIEFGEDCVDVVLDLRQADPNDPLGMLGNGSEPPQE
jgi:hypothetical protein